MDSFLLFWSFHASPVLGAASAEIQTDLLRAKPPEISVGLSEEISDLPDTVSDNEG